MGDIKAAMKDVAKYVDTMFYENPKNRAEDGYNKALHDVLHILKRVDPKPLAESDEKNEFAALCRRLGEKGPIARVDLQVARYVANKLYQKYGWDATRANDPRVTELVEAARQVEEWFDISNLEMIVIKRGPGDLIPNDNMAAWAIIRVIEALRKLEGRGT